MTVELVEQQEVDVVEMLSERQAKALDKKIRATSTKVETDVNALVELLAEAAEGQIHVALGYASWTAYVKDAVSIQVSDRIERKALVALMSGKGMSQRATAGVLGVSQKTVDRDLAEVESDDSAVTVGLDGKEYAKKKEPKAVVTDPAPLLSEPEPEKPRSFSDDFQDEVYQLENDVAAFRELIENDDRFDAARKRLATSKRFEKFRALIDELNDLADWIEGTGDNPAASGEGTEQ